MFKISVIKVAGWGIKDVDTDQKSAELRTFSVPSVNHENCLNESIIPKKFFKLLTADKFCAGHLNGNNLYCVTYMCI